MSLRFCLCLTLCADDVFRLCALLTHFLLDVSVLLDGVISWDPNFRLCGKVSCTLQENEVDDAEGDQAPAATAVSSRSSFGSPTGHFACLAGRLASSFAV